MKQEICLNKQINMYVLLNQFHLSQLKHDLKKKQFHVSLHININ